MLASSLHLLMYLLNLLIEFDFFVITCEEKAYILALFFQSYSRERMSEVWLELKVEWQFVLEDNVAFNSN